jgi:hypothetical protein
MIVILKKVLLLAIPSIEGFIFTVLIIKSDLNIAHSLLAALAFFSTITTTVSIKPAIHASSNHGIDGPLVKKYQIIEIILSSLVIIGSAPIYLEYTNYQVTTNEVFQLYILIIMRTYKSIWLVNFVSQLSVKKFPQQKIIIFAYMVPLIICAICSFYLLQYSTIAIFAVGSTVTVIILLLYSYSYNKKEIVEIQNTRYISPSYRLLFLQNLPSVINKNFDVFIIPLVSNIGSSSEIIYYLLARQVSVIIGIINTYQLTHNLYKNNKLNSFIYSVILSFMMCIGLIALSLILSINFYLSITFWLFIFGILSIYSQHYVIEILNIQKFKYQTYLSFTLMLILLIILYLLRNSLNITLLFALKSLTISLGLIFQNIIIQSHKKNGS